MIEFVDTDHVRRVPHDHGSVGKGRPALRPRRRPHAGRTDGHERQRRRASAAPTARIWARRFGGQQPASYDEFNRLEQFAKLQSAPKVKFKDLEAAISTRITYNMLPMQVRDRLRARHRILGAGEYHDPVREQGSAVPEEGRRREVGGQPLRPRHHHDAPPDHHF